MNRRCKIEYLHDVITGLKVKQCQGWNLLPELPTQMKAPPNNAIDIYIRRPTFQ
ncbi:hypothetical protein BDZ91DRAFT_726785 [Kalaharituber pfeilii]|nr:hypothetical protein BDZ91DRAFT_726785 [Kalaharituber pfeilii]